MATSDQKKTPSATSLSVAVAATAEAASIIKNHGPTNANFLNSTTPQQTHHLNKTKQQPQTARRNNVASAARRHTTPDMAASAAYGMVLCGSDEMEQRYRGRIEKVKFGVPVNEAFCPDIPATLLVLLLKVNKEGPLKKDIWRAPGNQAQVRKLSHIMQHGRLVNISNISVYTAASVIKRFLAKLPGGILGVENERQLFEKAEQHSGVGPHDEQQMIDLFCRIVSALPVPSRHLLVLLFGTFRVITDSALTFGTRMTPDAIAISVAPSLFHTCIHDGQRAKLEDIMRFKLASQVISKIIQSFGSVHLFPFECYEFYARITGKTLRRDENHWHISFHLPSRTLSQPSIRFERPSSPGGGGHEPSSELEQLEQSPTTSKQQQQQQHHQYDIHGHDDDGGIVTAPPSLSVDDFCEDEDVYGESLPELPRHHHHMPSVSAQMQQQQQHYLQHHHQHHYRRREQSRSLEESKIEWKYRASAGGMASARRRREEGLSTSMGEVIVHSEEEEEGHGLFLHSSAFLLESTRSLTYLEWVHERQTRRMKTRSEWFLSPPSSASPCSTSAALSSSCAGGRGCPKQSGTEAGPTAGRKGAHYTGAGCVGGAGCCSRSAELLLPNRSSAGAAFHEQQQHHRGTVHHQQHQQCHHHCCCCHHHEQHQQHHQRQLLPTKTAADEPMMVVSSSGEEEMYCCACCCTSREAVGCCSRAGCAEPSTDTFLKCSPQRPGSSVLSCCTTSGSMGCADAQMKSQTNTEDSSLDGDHDGVVVDEADDDAFLATMTTATAMTTAADQCSSPTKLVRQPFQLLQERQYSTSSTTEGSGPSAQVFRFSQSLFTQVTPSATTGSAEACKSNGGNGRQRFFGSGEQEGGLQALPELVETTGGSSTSPQARRYSAPFVSGSGIASTTTMTPSQQAAHPLQQQRSIECQQTVSTASSATCSSSRSMVAASMSSGSSSGGGSSSGNSTQTVIAPVAASNVAADGGQVNPAAGDADILTAQQQQQHSQLLHGTRAGGVGGGGGSGVARRRSWRVHYTRPKNKSFDYETSTAGSNALEEVPFSSHSTPLCQSPPGSLLFLRRRSSNGATGSELLDIGTVAVPTLVKASSGVGITSSAATKLVRRRSSNNGGGAKSKMPVQSRRSTQI